MANKVKLYGVRPNVINLQLFTFSLSDTTTSWFESLPYGSMNTWDELVEAFMGRFSPPAVTSKRREEIIIFKQCEGESLYNVWERYKNLLKRCPMHGIDQITHMDIFYHAMNYTSKGIIDAACCGAFKIKSVEEENRNYRAPFENLGSRSRLRGNGVIKLKKNVKYRGKIDRSDEQI